MMRAMDQRTWYEHAIEFVDVKWPHASPRHRKNISEALAAVTVALLPSQNGRAEEAGKVRAVLRTWSFNKAARNGLTLTEAVPPPEDAVRLRWIADNSP